MKKKSLFRIIENLLVLGLLAFFYLPGLSNVVFHPDESQWIATSNVFETYLKADFKSSLWDKSYWTLTQPPMVRYVIGFSRYLGGYHVSDLNQPWNFERNRNFNERNDAMPENGLLWWSRLPMAVLAIISFTLIFNLLKKGWGRFAAYLWIVFALINAYFLLQMRRAMGESSLLFFTIIGIYALDCAFNSATKNALIGKLQPTLIWLTLAGVASGLAGASKLNGLANLGACILAACISAWILKTSRVERLRFALLGSTLATLACAVVFVAINPFLWPNPVNHTIDMLKNRTAEMSKQAPVNSPDYVGDLPQRLQILPVRIFESYAALPVPWLINLGLFIVGVGVVSYAGSAWVQQKNKNMISPALLIGAIFAATPPLFTSIDWDRYYLFPVFFSTMLIAIGIGWLMQKLYGFRFRSQG